MMRPLTLEALEALAFATAPVEQANQAIAAQREARGGAESYEVVAGPQSAWQGVTLRRLVYFLSCRGVKATSTSAPGGLFISAFTPGKLVFLEPMVLVRGLAAAEGMDLSEAFRRHGSQGAGDPLLLA